MKQFKLPKEFAEKWLTALRSGEYKQGEGYLQKFIEDNPEEDITPSPQNCAYCCLGVAANIAELDTSELFTEWIPEAITNGVIPDEIVGDENTLPNVLSFLNDGILKIHYAELLVDYELKPLVFRHFDIEQEFTIKDKVLLDFNQIADFIEDNCEFYEEKTIKN